MDNKEKPKSINPNIKCKDCKYYEGSNWKPWWGERYCHYSKIFRTGLTDISFGCEEWTKNMKEKEPDFVIYFKECIAKRLFGNGKKNNLTIYARGIKSLWNFTK